MFAVAGMTASPACQAESVAETLNRLNRIDIPADHRVVDATDDGAIAAFAAYKFECRRQESFNPKESAKAKAKFEEFVRYFAGHPNASHEDKERRLALLKEAVKAGSWRADYVDLIWDIWENRNNRKTLQPLGDRLTDFAEKGVPIALYGFVHWMGNLPAQEKYRLLKEAIDRGSPQAMSLMSNRLGMHSLTLRKVAQEMALCAEGQNEPSAYDTLGQFAFREGRWVDAYRSWEAGANKGCEDCIDHMEEFSMLKPGFQLSDGFQDSIPKLKELRKYYADQFLYQITKMSELLVVAPKDMEFHVSNEQIIALIEKRLQVFGK